MDKHSAITHYTQLLAKVDGFFSAVLARQRQFFSCSAGCFGCCQSDLSVSPIEARFIEDWLTAHPDVRAKITNGIQMKNDPLFCSFLDNRGECAIYPARPIICRSHGAPVSWKTVESEGEAPKELRDVCPLNFQGVDLNELNGDDVLSLDKINMILSLMNRSFTNSDSAERVKLSDIKGRES